MSATAPISFHGTKSPFGNENSPDAPPVIAVAFPEDRGMEYEIREYDGLYVLGSCHEAVGLMNYWTSTSMEALTDFAEITDEML